jgi:hypothetical protein
LSVVGLLATDIRRRYGFAVLYFDGAVGVALVFVLVFCLLDAITADAGSVRNLSKTTWVILVVLLFEIGAIAWLIAGRPQTAQRSLPYKGNTGVLPEYDRPGRATATNPDDDAAFLAQLRVRAEAQRKAAAEQARLQRAQEDQPPQS